MSRVRGTGSFTPSLARVLPPLLTPSGGTERRPDTTRQGPVARSRNGLPVDGRLISRARTVTRTFGSAADERGRPDSARSSPGLSGQLRPTRRQPGRRDASIVVRVAGIRTG